MGGGGGRREWHKQVRSKKALSAAEHKQEVLFVEENTGSICAQPEGSCLGYRSEAVQLCSVKGWMVIVYTSWVTQSLLQVHSYAVLGSKQP